MNPTTIQIIATTLFCIAVLHTFSASLFEKLAHKQPNHAGLWHLLGEVEAVFGFWAMVLVLFMAAQSGSIQSSIEYVEGRNYTEPLFVFAIMVVAASRPILHFASELVRIVSGLLSQLFRLNANITNYFVTLSLVPLLGSFITEPAAMTLAALLLKKKIFSQTKNTKLMYLTIGVLFVNISMAVHIVTGKQIGRAHV